MSEPVNMGLWALPVAVVGGAVRAGTPFLFVSLGECITEKSGRVNLGLEGTLALGAMAGFAVSNLTQPAVPVWLAPWLGVLAAAAAGGFLGALHAIICNRPRVSHVAVGIAMMVFGIGLAYYLGKPFVPKTAPRLPNVELGTWSSLEPVRYALNINILFILGVLLAPLLAWMLRSTRWGMILRLAGESEEAAAAMGYDVNRIRLMATMFGGMLAGIGGCYLSLSYLSWKEDITSGQGLMAVALVIFARWNPVNCLWASLLFGGVGSLGSALQAQQLAGASVSYLWNAAPYVLTLLIMILTSSRARAMVGAPASLSTGG